ncbi:MAG TPA: zf-TFIIB domain-containing protein, partial [Agromyces sp.]|nr:zf-TFIIB domain-containing protein [Agromyces sp.]
SNPEPWRHEMNCPACNVALMMTERQGTEIDYCPKCRGVWLDRGELDKIIDRASNELGAAQSAPAAPAQPVPPQPGPPQQPAYGQQSYDSGNRGYDNRGYDQGGYRKKKKESWLSELFD